jgi:hypothetical protein
MSIEDHGVLDSVSGADLEKMLEEIGLPDPELLKGTTWDLRRYESKVDQRIYLRKLAYLQKCQINPRAYELVQQLQADAHLLEAVKDLLHSDKLLKIDKHLTKIRREERATLDADIQRRVSLCERCSSSDAQLYQWHQHPHRFCQRCAARLIKRQKNRDTRTNIQPALNAARNHKLPATLTVKEWLCTLDRFDDRCAYCGEYWTVVEHVTPIDRGGGTTVTNCLPSCDSCNRFKGSMTLEEWITTNQHGDERKRRRPQALAWLVENGRPSEGAA